jgi:hypothetical protein
MFVKGPMILDYVKIIRANKDRNWDRYLQPEDWDIINGQIFTTNKYPYEAFRRIGFAVFKEIAKSDLATTRLFGRFTMKNILNIYKNSILVKGDPLASMSKLALLRKTFMDGEADTKVIESGPKWARYQVVTPPQEKDEERLEAYCHQIAGHLEEIIEQTGGKVLKTEVTRAEAGYQILISWQ